MYSANRSASSTNPISRERPAPPKRVAREQLERDVEGEVCKCVGDGVKEFERNAFNMNGDTFNEPNVVQKVILHAT